MTSRRALRAQYWLSRLKEWINPGIGLLAVIGLIAWCDSVQNRSEARRYLREGESEHRMAEGLRSGRSRFCEGWVAFTWPHQRDWKPDINSAEFREFIEEQRKLVTDAETKALVDANVLAATQGCLLENPSADEIQQMSRLCEDDSFRAGMVFYDRYCAQPAAGVASEKSGGR